MTLYRIIYLQEGESKTQEWLKMIASNVVGCLFSSVPRLQTLTLPWEMVSFVSLVVLYQNDIFGSPISLFFSNFPSDLQSCNSVIHLTVQYLDNYNDLTASSFVLSSILFLVQYYSRHFYEFLYSELLCLFLRLGRIFRLQVRLKHIARPLIKWSLTSN